MLLSCQSCGHENAIDSVICAKCGALIENSSQKSVIYEIFSPLKHYKDGLSVVYNIYRQKAKLPFFFTALFAILALASGSIYLLLNFFIGYFVSYFRDLSDTEQFTILLISILLVPVIIAIISMMKIAKEKINKKKEEEKKIAMSIVESPKEKRIRQIHAMEMAQQNDTKKSVSLSSILLTATYYVIIYGLSFFENLPILSNEIFRFLLIIGNTILAMFPLYRKKSRPLALVILIGGGVIPYFWFDTDPVIFFSYLWILSLVLLYISHHISWKLLGLFTFIATAFITGFEVLYSHAIADKNILIIALHAFSYIFVFFVLFRRTAVNEKDKLSFNKIKHEITIKLKKQLDISEIFILFASTAILIYNLYSIFSNDITYNKMGFFYLGNAVPFVLLIITLRKKLSNQILLLLLTIASSYIIGGTIAIFHSNFTVVVFITTLIAFILIALGSDLNNLNIRIQGYFFLFISFTYLCLQLDNVNYLNIQQTLFDSSYYYLVSLGIIIFVYISIIKNFQHETEFSRIEINAMKIFSELLFLWFAFVYILTNWHTLPQWLAISCILPAYLLIYKGITLNLIFTKYLGYFLFILILIYSVFAYIQPLEELKSFGNYNLIATGILLITMKYWYIISHQFLSDKETIIIRPISFKISENTETTEISGNPLLLGLDIMFSIWFIITFMVGAKIIAPNWYLFLSIIPASLIIYNGYCTKKITNIIIGYIVYCFVFVYIIFYAIKIPYSYDINTITENLIPNPEKDTYLLKIGIFLISLLITLKLVFSLQNTYGITGIKENLISKKWKFHPISDAYYDLAAISKAILSFQFGKKPVMITSPQSIQKWYNIFWNTLSIWFAVYCFATFGKYFEGWTINFLILPMFVLLSFGVKKRFIGIELLGILLYIVMAVAVIYFISISGSIHLSDQEQYTKVLMIEVYACLWGLQLLYTSLNKNHPRVYIMRILRQVFYFLMPVVFAYFAYRRLNSHLSYAFWIVVMISLILTEISKNKLILYQAYLWILAAITYSLLSFAYIPATIGVAILWLFVLYKSKINEEDSDGDLYKYIPTISLVYSSLFLGFIYTALVSNDFSGGLFISAASFAAITYFREHLFPIYPNNQIVYRPLFLLIPIAVTLFFIQDFAQSYHRLVSIGFMLTSFFFMHRIVYGKIKLYPGKIQSKIWQADILILYIFYLAGYVSILRYFTNNLMNSWYLIVGTLVINGAIIIINMRTQKYQLITRLAIIIFSTALLTLFYMIFKYFR